MHMQRGRIVPVSDLGLLLFALNQPSPNEIPLRAKSLFSLSPNNNDVNEDVDTTVLPRRILRALHG